MTAPAVLAIASPLHGSCVSCGRPHEPGTIVADFRDTGGDRWPWRCPECTRRHLTHHGGGAR